MTSPPSFRRKIPSAAGFTLIEALIVSAVFSVVLLFFAHSTLSSVRLGQEQTHRTAVLQLTREFMERLKADDDWASLYGRLRSIEAQAAAATAGFTSLADGRKALPLGTYYADIQVPPELGDVVALIEVPSSPPLGEGTGARVLREDVVDPAWGLPGDLNGDGVVDSDPRDADYVALPVRVTFQWHSGGQGVRETRRLLWLGGQR